MDHRSTTSHGNLAPSNFRDDRNHLWHFICDICIVHRRSMDNTKIGNGHKSRTVSWKITGSNMKVRRLIHISQFVCERDSCAWMWTKIMYYDEIELTVRIIGEFLLTGLSAALTKVLGGCSAAASSSSSATLGQTEMVIAQDGQRRQWWISWNERGNERAPQTKPATMEIREFAPKLPFFRSRSSRWRFNP